MYSTSFNFKLLKSLSPKFVSYLASFPSLSGPRSCDWIEAAQWTPRVARLEPGNDARLVEGMLAPCSKTSEHLPVPEVFQAYRALLLRLGRPLESYPVQAAERSVGERLVVLVFSVCSRPDNPCIGLLS